MATKAKAPKARVEDIVAAKIMEALESGVAPWRAPYTNRGWGLPLSLSTRKPYRGINPLLLQMTSVIKGYSSPYWGTYKKITDLGGQVRKGEKSTMVTFWKRIEKEEMDDTGKMVKRNIFFLRFYNVFNAEQADELPERFFPSAKPQTEFDPIEEAEQIIAGYQNGPTRVYEDQSMAWYRPGNDTYNVPRPENMTTKDEYYSTTFHELTHSTGAQNRLAREGILNLGGHRRGETYSFEELVAEMGAAMLSAHASIDNTLENSAAYIKGWLHYLSDDPAQVIKAAGQAQKGVDLILGTTFDNNDEED